jgi:hypothetical protein
MPASAAACADATRPALGSAACVPVGDCSAAFPPPGAIVVDPAGEAKTLDDALATAQPGATIALGDGDFAAPTAPLASPVTIVGRCAARTHLHGPGLRITSRVALRGLALIGMEGALYASGAAASLDLDGVVVDGATYRALIVDKQAHAVMRGSLLRGTAVRTATEVTAAIAAGAGAIVDVEDSGIVDSADAAIVATDGPGTKVTLSRSVVLGHTLRPGASGGALVRAFEASEIDITESAISDAIVMGVLAYRQKKPPPHVSIVRSWIGRTHAATVGTTAMGFAVNAAYGSTVDLDGTTIADTEGEGVYAEEDAVVTLAHAAIVRTRGTVDSSSKGASALVRATVSLSDTAIVGVGGQGIGAWNQGHVKVARSLVASAGGDVAQGMSMAAGVQATYGSTIDLADSAIVDGGLLAAAAYATGSVLSCDRLFVTRSARHGDTAHAVAAVDGGHVTLGRSVLERAPGVALLAANGGMVVTRSLVRDNAIAVNAQDGTTLFEGDTAPDAVPDAELFVSTDTTFDGNDTRVGSDEIPLPKPLSQPPVTTP